MKRVRRENGASQKSGQEPSTSSARSKSWGGLRTSSIGFGAGPSSQSGRPSFLPKPSRPSSGIGVRGRTDIPKDPRPISDKKYINQNIKRLLEFLTSNTYPHPISQKLLVSPTSKDFFKIFAFIYSKVRPNYKMAPKMEDEVPRVLRMLGYPFSISKQYLYSVGSPHTWPNLLAALMWMIELIQMAFNVHSDAGGLDAFIFGDKDFDEDYDRKCDDQIFWENTEKCYVAFLQGDDTYERYDEELRDTLSTACQGKNIESLEEEICKLEEELNIVAEEEAYLKTQQCDITNLNHDERELNKYSEVLDHHKKQTRLDLKESEDSVKMCASDLAMEQSRLSEMNLVYQNQGLTPADVLRMKAEQGRLRAQVEQVEKQVEAIDSDNWALEIEQANANDQVEKSVAAYNRLAINLNLVPETAALADGKDYRLKAGFNSDIEGNFESIIKPVLQMLKIKHGDNIWRKNKEKFQQQCELEKTEEQVNEEMDRLANEEMKLSSIEAEISSLKQMSKTDKHSVSSEEDLVKQNIQQLESDRVAMETELAESRNTLKEKKILLEDKKQAVQKDLDEIVEYREKIKEAIKGAKENVEMRMRKAVELLKSALTHEEQEVERIKQESRERDERLKKLFEDSNR